MRTYPTLSRSKLFSSVEYSTNVIIIANEEFNGAGIRAHAVYDATRAGYCFRFVSQSAIAIDEVAGSSLLVLRHKIRRAKN
jgi:hypothetical protein